MTDIVNNLCNGFNNCIGKLSQSFLSKEKYETKITIKEAKNVGEYFANGLNDVKNLAENKVKYEHDKAIMAYNIKTTFYNVVTVLAIASAVAIIFAGPLALIPVTIGIAGRLFIDRAMKRTVVGNIISQDQVTDKTIYSLLFKSYEPAQ
jgi:hypothetical protein